MARRSGEECSAGKPFFEVVWATLIKCGRREFIADGTDVNTYKWARQLNERHRNDKDARFVKLEIREVPRKGGQRGQYHCHRSR
jgi:hypothetical protein